MTERSQSPESQSPETDPFADIRPYTADEAPAVLAALATDTELAATIAMWRLTTLNRWLPSLARWLAMRWLARQGRGLRTVEDLQNLIAPNLARMIKKTSRFTVTGLDQLDTSTFRVYVGNHRDIVMDPAYANYALHARGARTLAIAIGDNLLSKPWISDLMRLNKSFVVKRHLAGPRALLAAAKQLAAFIRQSVEQGDNSIWIAHREGRAKDGRDVTEPAVIKMLSMARDREESAEEMLARLRIVPLTISYELDPCDVRKAAELNAGADYKKSEFEDISSIATGITGTKGCVHLHFGSELAGGQSVEEVVRQIDRQMVDHYRLFPTNLWAWQWLHQRPAPPGLPVHKGSVPESAFRARIDAAAPELRERILTMYANPVARMLEMTGSSEGTGVGR
jgi:hypothetical protein